MIPGKAACLAVAAAATALYASGTGLGEAGRYVHHAQHVVADAFVGPKFDEAAYGLERYRDIAGTYDGASIGGGSRMLLRWANHTSYCVEGFSEASGVQHLLGPNGRVLGGPCPTWGF